VAAVGFVAEAGKAMNNAIMIIARNLAIGIPSKYL
jgi:hypothetical protein